jgi:hypothetical protein
MGDLIHSINNQWNVYSDGSGSLAGTLTVSGGLTASGFAVILDNQTGQFYPRLNNPSGYITGSTGGFLSASQTGILVGKNETGIYSGSFYPLNSNPSGYLTAGTIGGVNSLNVTGTIVSGAVILTGAGNVILTASGQTITFSGSTGSLVAKADTGIYTNTFVQLSQTGIYSGTFATLANTGLLLVGKDQTGIYTNTFVQLSQTGIYSGSFYPLNSNPSGYITGSTGGFLQLIDSRERTANGSATFNSIFKLGQNGDFFAVLDSDADQYERVAYTKISDIATGAWVLNSPIPRTANTMFNVTVRGQALSALGGFTGNLDFSVFGYMQGATSGNIDGLPGSVLPAHFSIRNNSSINTPIWLGVNQSGNMALAFGDTGYKFYFGRVVADANIVFNHNTGRYLTGWSWSLETGTNFGWGDRWQVSGYQQHLHDASNIASGTLPSGRLVGNYPQITGLGTLTALTVNGPMTISGFTPVTKNDTGALANSFVAFNQTGQFVGTGQTGDFLRRLGPAAVRPTLIYLTPDAQFYSGNGFPAYTGAQDLVNALVASGSGLYKVIVGSGNFGTGIHTGTSPATRTQFGEVTLYNQFNSLQTPILNIHLRNADARVRLENDLAIGLNCISGLVSLDCSNTYPQNTINPVIVHSTVTGYINNARAGNVFIDGASNIDIYGSVIDTVTIGLFLTGITGLRIYDSIIDTLTIGGSVTWDQRVFSIFDSKIKKTTILNGPTNGINLTFSGSPILAPQSYLIPSGWGGIGYTRSGLYLLENKGTLGSPDLILTKSSGDVLYGAGITGYITTGQGDIRYLRVGADDATAQLNISVAFGNFDSSPPLTTFMMNGGNNNYYLRDAYTRSFIDIGGVIAGKQMISGFHMSGITGNFTGLQVQGQSVITINDTGAFYAKSNPSGFVPSSDADARYIRQGLAFGSGSTNTSTVLYNSHTGQTGFVFDGKNTLSGMYYLRDPYTSSYVDLAGRLNSGTVKPLLSGFHFSGRDVMIDNLWVSGVKITGNAGGGGGVTGAGNTGAGSGLFSSNVTNNLVFKSLTTGNGIKIIGTPAETQLNVALNFMQSGLSTEVDLLTGFYIDLVSGNLGSGVWNVNANVLFQKDDASYVNVYSRLLTGDGTGVVGVGQAQIVGVGLGQSGHVNAPVNTIFFTTGTLLRLQAWTNLNGARALPYAVTTLTPSGITGVPVTKFTAVKIG